MSKLSDYLKKEKIDQRRLLAVSKKQEQLLPEDRKIKLAKIQAKTPDAKDTVKEMAAKKPRNGRALTKPTLAYALKGEAVGGPAKSKIVRAVNQVRKQQKKAEVTLKDLF